MQVLHEAGVVSARLSPLERAAATRRRTILLPRRIPARCALGGRSARLATPPSWRCESRMGGREFLTEVAKAEGIGLGSAGARRPRGRLCHGRGRPIGELLAAAGAAGAVLTFCGACGRGSLKLLVNRLANADHANLVRTSRAAGDASCGRCGGFSGAARARRGLPGPLQELAELRPFTRPPRCASLGSSASLPRPRPPSIGGCRS